MLQGLVDEIGTEILDMMLTQVPAGRGGEAEEIANLVVWLMSDEASYVNGAILTIDGGISAG